MDYFVNIENLSLNISGIELLHDISFDVEKGDIFAILGSNGSGKSLLLDCLLGNIKSSFNRNTILENRFDKQKSGILYDSFASIPILKVKEILSWLSVLFEKEMNNGLIEDLNINNILNKQLKVLSKGENKRLGIYAALFHCPELVILDEPSDGLDPIIRSKFWNILSNMDSTVIFTTHIWTEVENIATKILFLHKGKVLNTPMSSAQLIETYLPYQGKIAIYNTYKDILLINGSDYYEEENVCYFYYKGEMEKDALLNSIKKKVINYSVLPIELKDVYSFLTKKNRSS
ncbi:MAG: ABC transporter ATP-binding protein [Bacteroidales bacterium]|jgi:ABC-2 type transport system ATP-binding protein|nr:ABC transporter ATP-binding protein [Bacteroidales bacterium]